MIAPVAAVNRAPDFSAAAAAASVIDVTPTKPCIGINSAPRALGEASGSRSSKSAGAIQRASMPSFRIARRQLAETFDVRVRERKLERAVALIEHVVAAVSTQPRHEIVVEVEAAPAESAQQVGAVAFDVRRQDAGRGARRALSRRARLDDMDPRAGFRELVGDGAADDARATTITSGGFTLTEYVGTSRQKPSEKPISTRRGAAADVGVPKNGDSWLPMNAL